MRVLGISRFWVLFSFCGCVARGILFPSPETKWRPSAVNVDSPNLRTVREFPPYVYVFKFYCLYLEREGREKHYIIFVVVSHSLSHSVLSDSLWPHEPQQARPPCPSPTPRVNSNSSPSSRWCHPTVSSSVITFSFCLQSFPAPGSFPMSQLFTSGGQSIGDSASTLVLPVNIQDWFPLGWTDWISLQSRGLWRVFSNATVQKHQFVGAQLSLQSNSHIHTWLLFNPHIHT